MTQLINTKFEIGDKLFAFVEGNVVEVSIARINVSIFTDKYFCDYITNPVTVNGKLLCGVTIPEDHLYLTSYDCHKFETCVYCGTYKSIGIKEYKGEYFFNFNKQTFESFTSIEEAKEYIDILTTPKTFR